MMRKRIRASSLPPSPGEAQLELEYLDLLELGTVRQQKPSLTSHRRGKGALVSRVDDRPTTLLAEQMQDMLTTAVQPINSSVMNLSEGQQQIREETARVVDEVKSVVTQIHEQQSTIKMIATAHQMQIEKQNIDPFGRENAPRDQQSRLDQQQTSTYQNVSQLGHVAQSNQNVTRTAYQQLVSELEMSARASQEIQKKLNSLDEQQPRQKMEGILSPPIAMQRTEAGNERSSSSGAERMRDPAMQKGPFADTQRETNDQRTCNTQYRRVSPERETLFAPATNSLSRDMANVDSSKVTEPFTAVNDLFFDDRNIRRVSPVTGNFDSHHSTQRRNSDGTGTPPNERTAASSIATRVLAVNATIRADPKYRAYHCHRWREIWFCKAAHYFPPMPH